MAVERNMNNNALFVKFIYYFFKICGVATLSCHIKTSENDKVKHSLFTPSTGGILYNAFLICLATILSYFSIKISYSGDFTERIKFERVVDLIQTSFFIITTLLVLIIFCIQQHQMINIANRLHKLTELSINLNSKIEQLLFIDIKRIFVAHAVLMISFIITTPASIELTLYFMSITLCNIIISAFVIQYTVALKVIRYIFKVININLLETLRVPNCLLEINFIRNYETRLKLNKLSQLRESYILLGKVSQDLSNFYSPTIAMYILNEFLTMIIYSYYIVKPLFVAKVSVPFLLILHVLSQLLVCSGSLLLLTRSATAAVIEVK